jgi:lipopolysaccharide biosynthesis regulator YciM
MGDAFTSYWWIIIPLVLIFLALIFSLERRQSKGAKPVLENYIDGLRAMIEGDDSQAFIKLKQAVGEDTDNIDAYLKLGDLFRKRGQIQRAIQVHRELVLRKNLKREMANHVNKSLAEDYIIAKKFDQALEVLEKLAKDTYYSGWAQERILEIYEKTGQWEKAFNTCKGLLKSKDQQKRLAIYRHLIGNDHFNKGDFHKARLTYKDALHYDEKFPFSYIMLAESYLAEDRKQEAVDFYKKLAENVPAEADQIFHKMEQTLFDLGQFSEAETIYNNILKTYPDDTGILKSLASIAEKKGDITTAIDYLNQVVNIDSGDIVTAIWLASLYVNEGQNQQAYITLQNIQSRWQSQWQRYYCPHCNVKAKKMELVCPDCGRIGPYEKLA